MIHTDTENVLAIPRAKHLKSETWEAHDRLDQAIMAREPFANRERYALFVKVQYVFHREIDALYESPVLAGLLPDLEARRRLGLIEQDLSDLGVVLPMAQAKPVFATGESAHVPTALGWLYVAEGSNLGAAFLLKEAVKLGLSAEFGARHLAGAPEGRARNWKTFTAALDAIHLSDSDEAAVVAGAQAAFERVYALVEETFA